MRFDLVILGQDTQATQAAEFAHAHGLRTALVATGNVERLDGGPYQLLVGSAEFACPETLQVRNEEVTASVSADGFLIATGTRAFRASHLPLDDRFVVDADWQPTNQSHPRELAVVGQDAISLSRAIGWARTGTQVTLIGQISEFLTQLPRQFATAVQKELDDLDVQVIPQTVVNVRRRRLEGVELQLDSGETVSREVAMLVTRRLGNTGELNLKSAGLTCDETGRLWCDSEHRTWSPNIFAAGDVMGFPAAAANYANGGIRAVQCLLGLPLDQPEITEIPEWLPGTTSTINEFSSIPAARNVTRGAGGSAAGHTFPRLWSSI